MATNVSNLRTITPEEWEAVKREGARRAHAERAKAMRDLIKLLWSWFQGRKERRDPVVHAGKNTS
jgi:hypothetical protein